MSNSMQFNDDYCEQVSLPNATQMRLRLIRPDDKKHMVKAFEHLSSASRYKRFFGAKKALSEGELRYFTEIDQYNHFALGALELDDCNKETGGAGVARFIRLPADTECAEVGITIIDSAQGKGIGRLLLERLFSAAIERGIKRLRFECLAENQDMQRLVKKLTDHVKFEREDELLIAEIVIPKPCPNTNKYPLDVIEDMSVLIRTFSSEAFILYTDFSIGMFKHALDTATKYTMKNDDSLASATLQSSSIDIKIIDSDNGMREEINQTQCHEHFKYNVVNHTVT
ncbi:MAG: GNAT family N-acetyltransferase [Colwellia sp.]|nr:GNAT family N-acetyltransferase [Colwellia sp.]